MEKGQVLIMLPYIPRPGATVKEIMFNPGNMAITFIAGIGLGLLVELAIQVFT